MILDSYGIQVGRLRVYWTNPPAVWWDKRCLVELRVGGRR